MQTYDYSAPQYHNASRGQVIPDLLAGHFPDDRAA